MNKFLLASVAVLASVGGSLAAEKKIISFGWEFQKATPKHILANADRLKSLGINGVGISLRKSDDQSEGSEFRRAVINGPKYEMSDFADQLDDLKKISKIPHLKDSFILGYRAPFKRLAWTDDAAWEVAAHNLALIGRIARVTGFKGISCDHEDYHHQYQYVPAKGELPYDELRKIARQRGRQVFGALFRELPDARVLFYWFLTFEKDYFTLADPEPLVRQKQDLWPAFADGILDVLPPGARIIDGDEHAYNSDFLTRDFHVSACNQKLLAPRLVSPENREKHLRQVQVGFGLYLDMYTTPKGSYWYSPPVNGSRGEHFRRNLSDAVFLAEEYVWLWGERYVSTRWSGDYPLQERVRGKDQTWDEVIPGFSEALKSVRDDDRGLMRAVRALKGKERVDVNPNPACKADGSKGKLPKPYTFWHSSKNKDCVVAFDETTGDGDNTSLSLENSRGASIFVSFPVSAVGDAYELSVRSKYVGPVAKGRLSFRKEGRWAPGAASVSIAFSAPDESGWSTGKAYFTIPPGVDEMAIVLGNEKPHEKGDKIWFDNIRLMRVW